MLGVNFLTLPLQGSFSCKPEPSVLTQFFLVELIIVNPIKWYANIQRYSANAARAAFPLNSSILTISKNKNV